MVSFCLLQAPHHLGRDKSHQLVGSRHHRSAYILNSPVSCHILSTGRQISQNLTGNCAVRQASGNKSTVLSGGWSKTVLLFPFSSCWGTRPWETTN